MVVKLRPDTFSIVNKAYVTVASVLETNAVESAKMHTFTISH